MRARALGGPRPCHDGPRARGPDPGARYRGCVELTQAGPAGRAAPARGIGGFCARRPGGEWLARAGFRTAPLHPAEWSSRRRRLDCAPSTPRSRLEALVLEQQHEFNLTSDCLQCFSNISSMVLRWGRLKEMEFYHHGCDWNITNILEIRHC